MGCDGGTIPKRDELVRTRKKTPPRDRSADRSARWRNCAISQLPLRAPVVACRKGRMYNKDELIKAILDKRAPKHIRRIKRDVKDLPSVKGGDNLFTCPLSNLEMNGKYQFYVVWACGCVLSKRALQETNAASLAESVASLCPQCQNEYSGKGGLVELYSEAEGQGNAEEQEEHVPHAAKRLSSGQPVASVQDDPSASQVYKSLFNSCAAAKQRKTAHWPTYNPLYF